MSDLEQWLVDWLRTQPAEIQQLAREFPPNSVFKAQHWPSPLFVIGYEPPNLLCSPIHPAVDRALSHAHAIVVPVQYLRDTFTRINDGLIEVIH